jgi:hypothetical protein
VQVLNNCIFTPDSRLASMRAGGEHSLWLTGDVLMYPLEISKGEIACAKFRLVLVLAIGIGLVFCLA